MRLSQIADRPEVGTIIYAMGLRSSATWRAVSVAMQKEAERRGAPFIVMDGDHEIPDGSIGVLFAEVPKFGARSTFKQFGGDAKRGFLVRAYLRNGATAIDDGTLTPALVPTFFDMVVSHHTPAAKA